MKTTLTTKLATAAATTGMALAALVGVAGPAHAADTIATFAITAGGLSIAVPASTVALATGVVNTGASSASAQLGAVTVTDTRGLLLSSWAATVTKTAFVTGTSTPNETVTAPNVAYTSGTATSTGLGTFVPNVLAVGPSWTGVAGNNTSVWNPTLTFTLLSSQVAGTYSGTISHSVA